MIKKYSGSTLCVHSGTINDPQSRGSVSPIYHATSYAYLDTEKRAYPRYFNTPNQEAVAKKLCALEHAQDGLVFSSGMAAISTTLLTFLKRGDHAVIQQGLYGGTSHFISSCFADFDLNYTVTKDLTIPSIADCIQETTRLIYFETPSNPLLNITDIKAIADLARSKNIITLIDNTFASPINQNPLDLGIDIVIHSATKYLGGHSDICAGAVLSDGDMIEKIRARAKVFGGSLNAQTCYLLERSMKTLALRVRRQNENALKIAGFLQQQDQVEHVYYPGLEDHPGHEIAGRQMRGFGGMLSFELTERINPLKFQKALNLIEPSMSLGGVETIICSPALTSHAVLSREQRLAEGIKDGLLRLSVGIEEPEDLIADLQQAFDKF